MHKESDDKKRGTKDKKITNLRVHVEKPINRISNYQILKGTLPITMMKYVDEFALVYTALCNIKNVLVQTKKD